MNKINTFMMDRSQYKLDEIKNFFISEKVCDEEFFKFIKDRVIVLPIDASLDFVGCFPIVKNEVLKDIKLCVPIIRNNRDLLINIHEYYHALELYNELDTIYEDKRELREINAIEMEKRYIKRKPI